MPARPSRAASISPEEPSSALRKIPIRECGERLVDVTALSPCLYWVPRHPVFAYERARVTREGVARRLVAAAESLPSGLRLGVVEAWRAPSIQRRMHEETRRRLRAEHPEWDPRYLGRVANRFSAPMDPHAPPPHTTGGAVDVHLADASGAPLEFIRPYELMDPRAAPARAPGLSPEAERNRALLREAMLGAGFTNYPMEWWHWSFGDQAWAYRGGHPEALYGPIEPEWLRGVDLELKPHPEPGF